MTIISKPLRSQFFLEKMVFMTPTPKRVATVAIMDAIRASVQLRAWKAKGGLSTRAARPLPSLSDVYDVGEIPEVGVTR